MFCSLHARAFLLAVLVFGSGFLHGALAQSPSSQPQNSTSVHLRWGQRPGVKRYRLQLARDVNFADIVFDGIVNGNNTEINDLEPGKYFWRIAPLTDQLGEFSSAGVIDVRAEVRIPTPNPTPRPAKQPSPKYNPAGGGWRAALGEIGPVVAAHLRSPDKFDVVAMNAAGVVFALDATNGVVAWSVRTGQGRGRLGNGLLVLPSPSRLENIAVLAANNVIAIEGATGRELWRSPQLAAASGGVILDGAGLRLAIIDSSRQRLIILNGANGEITTQMNLPARPVGAPIATIAQGKNAFALAYENGDLELRDSAGAVIRSVNLSSPATTGPLFVRGRRDNLLLVGTRDGLAALTVDDLRALGRVSIPGDAPRGALAGQDLDGDGVGEVIMTTERRHLVAVNADDGKIIWDVPVDDYGDVLAFADINGDHVLDVFVAGGQRFSVAFSGRDGAVVWKDDEVPLAANHGSAEPRALITVPMGSSVLLIGSEPARTGLRAIAFAKGEVRPNTR